MSEMSLLRQFFGASGQPTVTGHPLVSKFVCKPKQEIGNKKDQESKSLQKPSISTPAPESSPPYSLAFMLNKRRSHQCAGQQPAPVRRQISLPASSQSAPAE